MGNAGYGNHTEDTKADVDSKRSEATKPSEGKRPPGEPHPAGPHADPRLTNPDSTPGAGTLPDHQQGDDVDSASG